MSTATKILSPFLNDREVAEMLGVSVATVRRWRLIKQGPRYLKLGGLCKYRPEDLQSWIESLPAGGASANC